MRGGGERQARRLTPALFPHGRAIPHLKPLLLRAFSHTEPLPGASETRYR